jgi:hypothetical protein
MIETDLKARLDEMNDNLVQIKKNGGVWKSFVRGILTGIGSVLGAVVAITIVGWVLNTIGVIPGFKEQAKKFQGMWQETLEQARRIK